MDMLHIRTVALSFCVRDAKKRQHGNCICLGLYIVSIHPILGYTFYHHDSGNSSPTHTQYEERHKSYALRGGNISLRWYPSYRYVLRHHGVMRTPLLVHAIARRDNIKVALAWD